VIEQRRSIRARTGAGVLATVAALVLSGCTSGSIVAEGSTVTVAVAEAFSSYNPNTGHGSAVDTNASIVAATNAAFASWGADGELDFDESFGTVEKVSDDPLAVQYTIADGVQWSDGTPVDAADLLLSWAANSRVLNDPEVDADAFIDQETGLYTEDFPADVVHFDGFTGNGLHLVTEVPRVSDDGRGLTLEFDDHVADWASIFTVGLPAHIVAAEALDLPGDTDPVEAKAAVVEAIAAGDGVELAAISRSWNSDFAIEGADIDPGLLIGSGPYSITELGDEGLTLTANVNYRGEHRPRFETIAVRYIADPLQAVAAVEAGEVDIVAPRPSADVMSAIDESGVDSVRIDDDGVWDLLQVRFDRSANDAIEDARVRRAFLHTVPRDELVEAAGFPGVDATPRDSFTMMPGIAGYDDSVERSAEGRIEYDAKRAASLLANAADDDDALAAPTVCILFDPANPRRVAQFSAIRDAAASVGFTVTDCSSPDWRNLLGTPDAWDAALYGLRERTVAVQSATAMFGTDSPLNHGEFSSEKADDLLDRLTVEEDAAGRADLRAQLDTVLWDAGWGLPLSQLPSVTVVADGVAGVSHSPFAPTVLWEPWRWSPEEPSAGS
jgi:peptide/nickel transport system substrate-binding protein